MYTSNSHLFRRWRACLWNGRSEAQISARLIWRLYGSPLLRHFLERSCVTPSEITRKEEMNHSNLLHASRHNKSSLKNIWFHFLVKAKCLNGDLKRVYFGNQFLWFMYFHQKFSTHCARVKTKNNGVDPNSVKTGKLLREIKKFLSCSYILVTS